MELADVYTVQNTPSLYHVAYLMPPDLRFIGSDDAMLKHAISLSDEYYFNRGESGCVILDKHPIKNRDRVRLVFLDCNNERTFFSHFVEDMNKKSFMDYESLVIVFTMRVSIEKAGGTPEFHKIMKYTHENYANTNQTLNEAFGYPFGRTCIKGHRLVKDAIRVLHCPDIPAGPTCAEFHDACVRTLHVALMSLDPTIVGCDSEKRSQN